jgi:hypothetical protein
VFLIFLVRGIVVSEEKQEVIEQPVYMLGDVMFVPHYSKKQWWVCAGGMERSTKWLVERYAKRKKEMLWSRYWTNDKTQD